MGISTNQVHPLAIWKLVGLEGSCRFHESLFTNEIFYSLVSLFFLT